METFVLLIILLILVGFLAYQVWAEQRWRRENQGETILNEKDHYRFLGLYYNRSDRRIFVSKRSGGGYTINTGNPMGFILFLTFIIGLFYLFTL